MTNPSLDHARFGVATLFAGTLTRTGNFGGLLVTEEAVVDSITLSSAYSSNSQGDLSDMTALPPGYYPCRFTSITLASGEGIAINEFSE